ncbi:MAG TPA: zf-HC2 domain-containing protein [Gemmatimonadales bacterium]|nr:zf-HC2 domain-containing protein [Gemmatimonadales bacterium]
MGESVNCAEALALLHDYLKQELTPEVADRIAAHLEYCRPCLGHAQFEQSFLLMIKSKAGGECCPEQLRLKILRTLRATSEPG